MINDDVHVPKLDFTKHSMLSLNDLKVGSTGRQRLLNPLSPTESTAAYSLISFKTDPRIMLESARAQRRKMSITSQVKLL